MKVFLENLCSKPASFYTLPLIGRKVAGLEIPGAPSTDLHAFRELVVSSLLSQDDDKRSVGVGMLLHLISFGVEPEDRQETLKMFISDLATRVLGTSVEKVRMMSDSMVDKVQESPLVKRLFPYVQATCPCVGFSTFSSASFSCPLFAVNTPSSPPCAAWTSLPFLR